MTFKTNTIEKGYDLELLLDAINHRNRDYSNIIMTFLENTQLLKEDDIQLLLSRAECRKCFKSDYPILKQIDVAAELNPQIKDGSGHNRYYSNTYVLNDRTYVMTSQLYGYNEKPTHEDNRIPFWKWVVSKAKKNSDARSNSTKPNSQGCNGFFVGDRIYHKSFGEGIIDSIQTVHGEQVLIVLFDKREGVHAVGNLSKITKILQEDILS